MNITAGEFKGYKIIVPDENVTRPTLSKVRMAVFNTLQSIIDFEGKSFFDMFAGSGIMGLEALSRGFKTLYACEQNRSVAKILKNNYKKFETCCDIKVVCCDCLKSGNIFTPENGKYDVVYIDPPYFSGIYEKSLHFIKNKADIIVLEHVVEVDFKDFILLKQKKYGNKIVSFLRA